MANDINVSSAAIRRHPRVGTTRAGRFRPAVVGYVITREPLVAAPRRSFTLLGASPT